MFSLKFIAFGLLDLIIIGWILIRSTTSNVSPGALGFRRHEQPVGFQLVTGIIILPEIGIVTLPAYGCFGQPGYARRASFDHCWVYHANQQPSAPIPFPAASATWGFPTF